MRVLRQIRPDGSGLRKLYDSHGGLAAHPHFSPDSQRIVFTCDCSGAARPKTAPRASDPCCLEGTMVVQQSTWRLHAAGSWLTDTPSVSPAASADRPASR